MSNRQHVNSIVFVDNPVDDAPITDSISAVTGQLSCQTLDIVMSPRLTLQLQKTS